MDREGSAFVNGCLEKQAEIARLQARIKELEEGIKKLSGYLESPSTYIPSVVRKLRALVEGKEGV